MDSLPPGHHPDWRTSVLLLIWGTASPGGFLGTGGSCLPRYAGAPREHGLAMLGAPGEFMRGRQPQHPPVGLPGPHPGFLSFHDERNQRRARGAAPGPRWGVIIIPPAAASAAPPRKGCLFGWHASHKPPAAPRPESRRCALSYSPGRKKTSLPTHLKVANRSGFVVETLLGGAATPQGGQRAPLRGSRGAPLANLW